ncbi:MAG: hypothetical protein MJ227_04940 [Bacilli bacterium]|nr:hypothetical protein [Bacilli bacterium]
MRKMEQLLKEKDLIALVMAIVATVSCGILGWVDLVWCLVIKHMILAK